MGCPVDISLFRISSELKFSMNITKALKELPCALIKILFLSSRRGKISFLK